MAKRPSTLEQVKARLLERRIVDPETGCWEWTGCKDMSKGGRYGRMSAKVITGQYRSLGVHVISAILWLGFDLNSGLCVCHKCDNPPCFNPEHLFIGTQTENLLDASFKNRTRSKIQISDIPIIQARIARGDIQGEIARDYNISHSHVSRIKKLDIKSTFHKEGTP